MNTPTSILLILHTPILPYSILRHTVRHTRPHLLVAHIMTSHHDMGSSDAHPMVIRWSTPPQFEVSLCPSPILEKIYFVDTPGVLSGEKQRIGRQYDFSNVIEWFAQRADRILLLFDAHKVGGRRRKKEEEKYTFSLSCWCVANRYIQYGS